MTIEMWLHTRKTMSLGKQVSTLDKVEGLTYFMGEN